MLAIATDIKKVSDGIWPHDDNPSMNAQQTAAATMSDDWPHAYNRQQASVSSSGQQSNKYWPPIGCVDNAFGDRNLIFTCPPIDMWKDAAD